MILVTGATGTIGSALVGQLLARDVEVIALTRDPSTIEPRPGLTVTTEIRKADAVFLLAPPGPAGPDIDRAYLRRAVEAGAERVVKLSAIGTPDEPDPKNWHQPGEQAVRESGLAWTILRPTTFATNSLAWAADIRAGRPIPNVFGAGRQGVIDPADIAAVAAEALTTTEHGGRVYTLTGPELLSVPEQVAQLGEVLRTTLTTVDVPPTKDLFPAAIAEVALAGAKLVREGGNAIVTDDVERVLGRRPGTYRAWAEENRTRFYATS
ncbi:NAD(P)H-binding protein [Paractinoplanes globisporus]|uniref:NAD(P)H-binding protein n=1 Tax=Paractinoplanes globisporus TaxID=113565 RepID=A0ABW6WK69_9ACTN|nr:NAD(P)H-binding protein [Actinoplanes globisporus]